MSSNEPSVGKQNGDDEDAENSVLIRDLEIEVFSSTQDFNVEKCIRALKKAQDFYNAVHSEANAAKDDEKSLEDKLLDQKIELEKANLENNESSRLISDLSVQKKELETRFIECKTAAEASQIEFDQIEPLNKEFQKQWQEVQSLNQEIVKPEFEKRHLEHDVVIDKYNALKRELETKQNLLEQIVLQRKDTEKAHNNAASLLEEKKEMLKAHNDEMRLAKKKKLLAEKEKEVLTKQSELDKIQNDAVEKREKFIDEDSKTHEVEKALANVNNEFQELQVENNKAEDELASLSKTLAIERSQQHSYATTRMQLEIDHKEVNEKYRHEKTSMVLHQKQLERMKRLYVKKKHIVERTDELIQQLHQTLKENEKLMSVQEKENSEETAAIDELKDAINIKITRLMEQEYMENDVKEELTRVTTAIEEDEYELQRWRSEVKKLRKINSILIIQRETQMKKTRNIINNAKETAEMGKLKRLQLIDQRKVLSENNKRERELSALYEVLKNERNEIESTTAVTKSTLSSLKHKLQEDQQKLQILYQSQEMKKLILEKERDALESSKKNKSNLNVEKTKLRSQLREKQIEVDRQNALIAKLCSTVVGLERESKRLKTRNDRLEDGKRIIAGQLEDKKVEVHKLLLSANTYEEVLKKGGLSIQEKKEDLRVLRIQCADVERHISLKKSLQNDVESIKLKIHSLEDELNNLRKEGQSLSCQLEDPMQCNRWRELGGEDLDDEELDSKVHILLERVKDGKEKLVDREVMLDELLTRKDELQETMNAVTEKTQPIVKRLNDYQTKLRDVTRSMMALVSELSMYQAISLRLQKECEQQEESLILSQGLVEEGQSPSDDALKDLKRLLRDRSMNNSSRHEKDDDGFGHVFYPAPYALRTTAEPRPSAYIPDSGIEIPRPFGFKPFKPSESNGTTMRRIHPPSSYQGT